MMIEVEVKAPGKAILHGEHSVVYGTKAIGVAVGLYTKVKIVKQQETDVVHVVFQEVGLSETLPIAELQTLKEKLGICFSFSNLDKPEGIDIEPEASKLLEDYINFKNGFSGRLHIAYEATFRAFLCMYLAAFDNLEPLSLTVETELPVGAGLGSSASFAVALAGGLLASSGRLNRETVDTDMVNRWAFVSEKFVHGNPSGIDNTVVTLGGALVYQKTQPLIPIKCSDINVLLVSTEVSHSTKELVARTAELKATNPKLHQQYMDEASNIVEKAIDYLEKTGQIKPEYVEQNQILLQNLNVSHPRLDMIADTAKRHDFRAKLTGAGGGGCAFVVIPPNCSAERVDKLKEDLLTQCNEFKFWSAPLGVCGVSINQINHK